MTVSNEQQFARLLWSYPKEWRRRNGAVAIGVALDIAERDGRSRPTWSEWLNMSVYGLATTAAGWLPGRVRDSIAQSALGAGIAFALTFFWFHGWRPEQEPAVFANASFVEPFTNPGVVICALWVLAIILSMTSRHTLVRVTLAVAVTAGLLLPVVNQFVPAWNGPTSMTLLAFNVFGLLAMLGTPRSKQHLIATGIVIGLVLTITRLAVDIGPGSHDRSFWISAISPEGLGWLLVLVLLAAAVLLMAGRRTVAESVAAIAVPWLPILVARAAMWDMALGIASAVAIALVSFVGIALHRAGVRVVRVRDR